MTTNRDGCQVYKTPAANMIVAVVYLENTQPPEGDPRAEIHCREMAATNAAIAIEASRQLFPAMSQRMSKTESLRRQSDSPPSLGDSLPHREASSGWRASPPPRQADLRNAHDDLVQAQVDQARALRHDARGTVVQHAIDRRLAGSEEDDGARLRGSSTSGLACFSFHICETPLPTNFWLPSST